MTIYKKTKPRNLNYRRIYIKHFGAIPKDELGRSYEVHHIDGNRLNNSPDNLVALSIQEHYDVHYSQGDWAAARFIAQQRLGKTKEELAELTRLNNKKMIADGTHPFLKDANGDTPSRRSNRKKVADGTHHLLDGSIQRAANEKRLKEGTHNFQNSGKDATRYKDTAYDFINKNTGEVIRSTQYDLVKAYGLHDGNVSSVVSGRRSSTGGWSLLKTE